ncbi:MAG: hypothetical protein PHO83_01920 [Geobacteraceae bacterium]|nr:hypothetical protein [Geobacteraceae bacterium]
MKSPVVPRFVAAVLVVTTITACAPSMPYMLGNGFYSESYSKAQMQAAANNGKVKFLGKFTEDGTACGNYVQEATDNNLVLPVVKSQLASLGGNAADNIVAKWNFADFMLGITLLPAILGCRSYTISGEALLVQP